MMEIGFWNSGCDITASFPSSSVTRYEWTGQLFLLVLSVNGAQIVLQNTILCYLMMAKSVLMLIKVKI